MFPVYQHCPSVHDKIHLSCETSCTMSSDTLPQLGYHLWIRCYNYDDSLDDRPAQLFLSIYINISQSFLIFVIIKCLQMFLCFVICNTIVILYSFLFVKFLVETYFSNICRWQQSLDFCRNVSKLQLFTESEF